MNNISNIPWLKINELLLESGSANSPTELSKKIIQNINSLVPYDQAKIFFYNDNLRITNELLYGIDKHWAKVYDEYYSKIEDGKYAPLLEKNPSNKNVKRNVRTWLYHPKDEFIRDYVNPQGILYSFGFVLKDNYNSPKILFMLDRTTDIKFNDEELEIFNIVLLHLNNLCKNLYIDISTSGNPFISDPISLLTPREAEIAKLIKYGVTPTNISKKLYISQATVYKHISNIYKKFNVTTRQEMILRMMS